MAARHPMDIHLPSLNDPALQEQLPDLVDLDNFIGEENEQSWNARSYDGYYSGSDTSDDETDEDDISELIPRSVKRDENIGLRQTIQKLGDFAKKDNAILQKLETEEYLETHDQEQFIENLREQARVMASLWRYVALFCTGLWTALVTVLFLTHVFIDIETFNFHHAHTTKNIGTGLYLSIEAVVVISSLSNIWYASQIPRFTDTALIIAGGMTLMSFLLYNVSLFMVNAFTIYDCMLPTFNLLLFGIVSYAYYSIQALHWEIYGLKKSKYTYQSI